MRCCWADSGLCAAGAGVGAANSEELENTSIAQSAKRGKFMVVCPVVEVEVVERANRARTNAKTG